VGLGSELPITTLRSELACAGVVLVLGFLFVIVVDGVDGLSDGNGRL